MLSLPITRRELGKLAAGTGILAAAARPAFAALATPAEHPILTISGKIRNFNNGQTAQFDRPMLEALGMTGLDIMRPWYNKVVHFEGPLMTSVLAAADAFGDGVVVTALDDYSAEIPRSDFAQFKAILALKRDGNDLTVRDRGPLFLVYPYDSDPELQQQKYYGRSVWQVARVLVK
jgi:hypothetical protein